ncbi:MAG: endonuclease [Bacteroidia bacterium]|nr:endonuclease [Bacteroidia bacterium]
MIKNILATALCLFSILLNAQTTLPTYWNFSTPGISAPPNGWSYNLTIGGTNLTYSGASNSVGGDNVSCRLDATGEYLTIWFADKPGPVSYWIKGTGISPAPAFTGTFKVQESVDGNNWTDVNAFTTLTNTMTRYLHSLQVASRYVRFYYTDKQSGSNVALDSVVIQAAPAPPTATMNLKQGATSVVNNSQYVVGTSTSTVFTIENKGTVDTLFITGHSVTGAQALDYTVNNMPAKVAPNSSANFTLNFTPTANGSRLAKLNINNSDADKSTYTVNLYGIGGLYATEPVNTISNLIFNDIRPYGFRLNFSKTSAENYLVLRNIGSDETEIPHDGNTYKKGDYIGTSQVAYIGNDSTVLPTYIFAGTVYTFAVIPFNGPAGFENYKTDEYTTRTLRTPEGGVSGFYSDVNSSASDFVTKLSQLTNPHDTVFYSQYIARVVNNYLTRDTTGGKKVVNCVYTRIPYVYDEPFVWWSGSSSGILTREHTFSQSWMPSNQGGSWPNDQATGKELPEYNDLHNLFPAEQNLANGKRSNYPFGEIVGAPTYVSPSGMGRLGKDAGNNTVYEPADFQKGEVARALFYMVTAYNGINGKVWTLPSGQNQDVLKKWHFQDLPDAFERARHELIYDLQGNRNPFIDSPNFACRINFSNMSWVATPDVNCGVSQLKVVKPDSNIVMVADDVPGTIIGWQALKCDSIRIEYLVNDTAIYTITNSTTTKVLPYFWAFSLPIPTDSVRVKISDITNPAVFALSKKFKFQLENVGAEEIKQADGIRVYPNPVSGNEFYLTLPENSEVVSVKMFNTLGQQIPVDVVVKGAKVTVNKKVGLKGIFILSVQNGTQQYFARMFCH